MRRWNVVLLDEILLMHVLLINNGLESIVVCGGKQWEARENGCLYRHRLCANFPKKDAS